MALGDPSKAIIRPDCVVMQERWESLPALRAHLTAPHMTDFRGKVKDFVKNVKVELFESV